MLWEQLLMLMLVGGSVTGEQESEPVTACYETATFNDDTCSWVVTGEQESEPVTACYETATADDTCEWDVTGERGSSNRPSML